MTRALGVVLCAAALAAAPGCKCSGQGAPDAGEDLDRVRPNYDLTGPTDPLAARLCEALHTLPANRRAQCCPGGPASAFSVASQCTPMLSAALRSGAVKLDPAAADRCVAALNAAYSGCAWVGPNAVPLPVECSGIFTGTRWSGTRCRSSLECQGELQCLGVGPTDLGMCAPSRGPGSRCETAVDALAAYTRQDDPRLHPECEGFCLRHICRPAVDQGAPCILDAQCKRGLHCAKGTCAPGQLAKLGEPCSTGGCEASLRCVQDTCRAPAPDGTPCSSHLDCQGACIPGDAGARCGSGCRFQ